MYKRIDSNTTIFFGARVRQPLSSGSYENFTINELLSDNEEYELKSTKVITGNDTGVVLFIGKSSMVSGKWEILIA